MGGLDINHFPRSAAIRPNLPHHSSTICPVDLARDNNQSGPVEGGYRHAVVGREGMMFWGQKPRAAVIWSRLITVPVFATRQWGEGATLPALLSG